MKGLAIAKAEKVRFEVDASKNLKYAIFQLLETEFFLFTEVLWKFGKDFLRDLLPLNEDLTNRQILYVKWSYHTIFDQQILKYFLKFGEKKSTV